jgi:hypothetical protein
MALPYPKRIEDFDAAWLDSDEWTALADYCERELRMWERMLDHEHALGIDDSNTPGIVDDFRQRTRIYKAYAAEAETRQTKFEEEEGT